VDGVGSAAVACVTWVRGVCILLRRVRKREMILSMGVIGSPAVACVVCVRGGCKLLRWTRQREARLSVVVTGDGGDSGGDIGGGGGGDCTESSGPARKDTCSGKVESDCAFDAQAEPIEAVVAAFR
jgi:hypothetical protein